MPCGWGCKHIVTPTKEGQCPFRSSDGAIKGKDKVAEECSGSIGNLHDKEL